MELFNKFRDTVVLNDNSRVEKQVAELKKIQKDMDNKIAIQRDIILLEAGLQGEKNILYELQNANIGMFVIQDVTLRFEDFTAQIDFIIVTKAYIYLLECKNLIGNITVSNMGEFKREYNLNGKNIKEAIYSPLTQANRHKDIIKKIWLAKHNKFTTFLFERNFEKRYKPLVVLANSKSLLNIKYAPLDVKRHTIRVDQLLTYIRKDIASFDKDLYFSKREMQDLANSIIKDSVEGNNNFVEKYTSFHKQDEISLENKLKNFRKEKSAKMNVPAYYIFTNEELEKIVKLAPRTIEELESYKVLSSIKLKCHGEDILKIILESDNKK